MFRFWTERAMPPEYAALLDGKGTLTGSAAETPDDPLVALHDSQAIIASARLRYDGALMDLAPQLRVISRTGIGLDNVVVEDATARGIAICHTPDAPTVSTAEHALALLFACAKQLPLVSQELREGVRKDFFNASQSLELAESVLGLVGLGRIGSHVAKVALAIGMRVVAFDPAVTPERAAAKGVEWVGDFDELLSRADIVSLHAPYTPSTHKLMNAERLAKMKRGAILINAARGGLVDEAALIAALDAGQLRGAGLDVFDPEPPPRDNPLLSRSDCICTPHVAGVTTASRQRAWEAESSISIVLNLLKRSS